MGETQLKASFYRDPDRAWLAGVCAGIANHFGIAIWIIRLVFLSIVFMTGVFPSLVLYIVLAFWLPVKPASSFASKSASSSKAAGETKPVDHNQLNDRLEKLAKKVEKIETYVISDAYKLDREIHKLRGL